MGLLDDAIREHLELKRRHGASDEEINQNEAEALGPARRALPAEPDGDGEPAGDAEHAEEVDTSAEPASEVPVEEPPIEPPPIEPPPVESPPVEPPPVETEDDLEEPEPEEPESASEGEDEDVLEDTPEFLQDAPEHDRLWF